MGLAKALTAMLLQVGLNPGAITQHCCIVQAHRLHDVFDTASSNSLLHSSPWRKQIADDRHSTTK